MESSRSGLLSTLLMTLPLIVVPAIALLRPPGQMASVSTRHLDASDDAEDELLDEFDIVERTAEHSHEAKASRTESKGDEFDELFAEEVSEPKSPSSKTDSHGESEQSSKDDLSNPFDVNEETSGDPAESSDEALSLSEKIVEQLNVQGALRTMWFEAGPKAPVGFAAFFRGQTELMRMRFEAVGQSREECARSVLQQVNQWQTQQKLSEE